MTRKILIVDDSSPMRTILRRAVTMAYDSVEIHLAEHGEAALACLAKESIDIVLTDVNMPVMNGVELVRRMHGEPALRRIPIVMITSDGSEARRHEAQNLGVAGFLQKPVTPNALRDLLDEVLEEDSGPSSSLSTVPDETQRQAQADIMREIVGQVMESAFIFVEDGVVAMTPTPSVYASVTFSGAKTGELRLWLALDQAREAAQNLVDASDDETTAQMVGELANVICGRTLGRLFPNETIALATPDSVFLGSAALDGAVLMHGQVGYVAAALLVQG